MTQTTVSPATAHERDAAIERIRRLSRAGLDVAGFLDAVNPVIARQVANGTDTIHSPFWFMVDPDSYLVTSIYGQGCDLDPSEYMRWELFADDVMKTADVLQDPRGVQTLHEVTEGRPERSRIYVDVMAPSGMAQELLVALRGPDGANWGTARLNRSPGEPMFSEADVRFTSDAAPLIADGIRRGLLVGEATDPEGPNAPGLVVIDAGGDVESMSPAVEEWFSLLPHDDGRDGGLPTSVLAAAAGARRDADLTGDGGASMLRVPMRDGRWAVIDGAAMGTDGNASVTVIIMLAHPERIAPLLMSAYGLTPREQEVTRAVLTGGTTIELAQELRLSHHTVQQHLKHIFEKTDVNSRGELVARVYFDCYDPRVHDNRERISSDMPIRGGPRTKPSRGQQGGVAPAVGSGSTTSATTDRRLVGRDMG